jgi:hypothetical protein
LRCIRELIDPLGWRRFEAKGAPPTLMAELLAAEREHFGIGQGLVAPGRSLAR